jgi:hypothetical protein
MTVESPKHFAPIEVGLERKDKGSERAMMDFKFKPYLKLLSIEVFRLSL